MFRLSPPAGAQGVVRKRSSASGGSGVESGSTADFPGVGLQAARAADHRLDCEVLKPFVGDVRLRKPDASISETKRREMGAQ
jgi:hypothetical protein